MCETVHQGIQFWMQSFNNDVYDIRRGSHLCIFGIGGEFLELNMIEKDQMRRFHNTSALTYETEVDGGCYSLSGYKNYPQKRFD